MCGIVGEFSEDYSLATVRHLTSLMVHRGPDDEGFWTDGVMYAVGFRRLAILDLAPTGHQPMVTEDGRYVLAFNGEIYNFQVLREQLTHQGVKFRSSGDTEVILYALALWGISALAKFNGMFALAFYDRLEQKLLIARDHAGIKPLYYLQGPRGLVFASQFDQIAAHPWGRASSVDLKGLALYLEFGYIPAPNGLLCGSHMLEPGTWLEIDAHYKIRTGTHFRFPAFKEPDLHGDEAVEATGAAVDAAVKRQLISDVPVGAFLSGGIDSPLVAAMIAKHAGSGFKAFTIRTLDPDMDESMDAAEYAREFGLDHVVAPITSNYALANVESILGAASEPVGDYSIIPTYLVSQLARREVTVSLSGDGGDEIFWGYATRFGRVLRHVPRFQQHHWLRLVGYGADRIFRPAEAVRDMRFATIGERYRAAHTYMPTPWIRRILPEVSSARPHLGLFEYDGFEAQEAAQCLRWNEYTGHLTRVLLKVDRASMAHSLEVRVPLLDKEVIETATRIDWRSCLSLETGLGKQPLRRVLARHTHFQTSAKKGFTIPLAQWFKGPLSDMLREMVLNRQSLLGVPVNRVQMQRFFTTFSTQQANYVTALWSLLALAYWEDHISW